MGKGDKRTRRGKIFKGSFGNTRPHKVKKKSVTVATSVKPKKVKTAKEESPVKKAATKKTAAKKAPAKKASAKKKTEE